MKTPLKIIPSKILRGQLFRVLHPRALWRRHRPIGFALALFVTCVLALLYWPMNREACLNPHASGEMLDRSGRLMYAFLNDRAQWCFGRELDEISPLLIQATLAAEDQRFYRHPGIDPIAVLRAIGQNLSRRRVVSGASTLTMQVVKQAMAQQGQGSASLLGKLGQALGALRLERHATKAEILRAYLNTAPYGLNLIGCEAAARRYFGKPARELTLAEAALIAGLPKAPTPFMPLNLKHGGAARRRRNHVLARMRDESMISAEQYRRALAEPLRAEWHAFPALAPHLAMRLRPAIRTLGRVATALDLELQQMAEQLVRRNSQRFGGEITNAAMLVIDVPTAAVLAHVGAAYFYDTDADGQVDVTRSPRSPGSALKPFTYGLAMERNCLYASETLLDDSADYGLYNPENMDRQYHGLVTASDALRRSLNVPAVTVLGRIGPDALYQFLRGINLTTLKRPAQFYGLGLTLGSCEVRLEELAAAYALLANLGEYRPLEIVRADQIHNAQARNARRVLSRASCLKLYEMLEQPLPRELDGEAVDTLSATTRVCWKTGTSWGHHDAWAFVFNRQYLVAVWTGNNDGKPSPALVGVQAALPLAGRMFRAIKPSSAPAWPSPGEELHEVKICALSGLPASDWCQQTRTAWLPRGQFLNRLCDMHYPLPGAPLGPNGAGQVSERWPASAKGWDLAHITSVTPLRRRKLLPGNRTNAFAIRTPANHAEFILSGATGGDRLSLATSLDDQAPVYWYQDDRFLGTAEPWQPLLLDLTVGPHKLVGMTPQGLTDEVHYEVTDPATLLAAEDN